MAMAAQQQRWVDFVPVNGNGAPPPALRQLRAPRPPVTSFGISTWLSPSAPPPPSRPPPQPSSSSPLSSLTV